MKVSSSYSFLFLKTCPVMSEEKCATTFEVNNLLNQNIVSFIQKKHKRDKVLQRIYHMERNLTLIRLPKR